MDLISKGQALVSVDWLKEHIKSPNLIVLDASMPKAGKSEDSLSDVLIQGARFMDLKNQWAMAGSRFPNTMLNASDFEKQARQYGINKDSTLVVYDEHGIYSSARAWYMFRAMGHDNIAVLDGGFPAWLAKDFPVEKKTSYQGSEGNFASKQREGYFQNYKDVLDQINDDSKVVLDARAHDRFMGLVPEPRQGLRSGHIPNSVSLPFGDLQIDGQMKNTSELEALFSQRIGDDQTLVFSCGSGITACVLALGAALTGRDKVSVYDGSWTEWGSLPELPIA